jgi:hypothetical protein
MATLTEGLLENHIPVTQYHGVNTNKNVTVGGSANVDLSGSTGTFKFPTGTVTGNDSVALAATFTEINRACDASTRIVNATAATLTVTEASHDNKVITLNRAAGIAVTLPAATGSGTKLLFVLGTTVTSNTTTIKVVGDDTMTGTCIALQDGGDTMVGFETASDSDTITWNGTTTGGVKGDSVELIDIAADLWFVRVVQSATGTEATPFSATVS